MNLFTKYIAVVVLTFALATTTVVHAQSTTSSSDQNISALLEVLQSLMKQVEELQKRLAEVRGEIRDELKAGLKEGMEDEDVKKIQELLASDPSIYPRGIVSGYYGPLTADAIKRFQEKHGLAVSGLIDEETRGLINEYFKEKKDGRIPPGLLRATEVRERVKARMQERLDNCDDLSRGRSEVCKKMKEKFMDLPDSKPTVVKAEAEEAIAQAKMAIGQLEDAIDDASSNVDVEEAEHNLEDAEEQLKKAEKALGINYFKKAFDYARKAQKEAKEGLSNLNEEDEEDEDDD